MTPRIKQNREQRIRRSRAKAFGTLKKPRLSVYRSNKNLSLQLIDDESGKTIVAASTRELKNDKMSKSEQALAVGELLAKKAKDAKITSAIFDRRFYKYHGRVKAVAEGARRGGLNL
ncbi:MAG: 50S ribosomal protein L18 [Parcubacteria group bacterium GW2011_GWB1_45_7]|uniref:Large ribosomal subunit protein uL18 n=4 Tax=Parcubacteria group TaxID=1794811 RepID=A0A0H4TEZ8_9BACT|nr:50S ribosomal protein L18, large subunit ribosomal protein L18 [uncultured Parcubacteria bacterium Rifle_16ft_4_minimus_37647]AKQ05595.1 50S ribosomal protein L18, large subunit ribosomal protein L18 [uncultured Parcubacteria bacterium Rifle_16ft_4_minimus_23790]KKU11933.1 MAG: 50S ribosomal protein L18 [Parcubacteria group bacterium GW2011_GWB1_45_7]OGY58610.1 MAG: 50S ribosomal protein L18 [Candidatus Colwellbacteria bacterium RIFCSPHIGHO2_02_FULL_45_17]OGY61705.1 MAG: 50S ribosomal protei